MRCESQHRIYVRIYIYIQTFTYTYTLVVCMYCIFFESRSANMLWLVIFWHYFDHKSMFNFLHRNFPSFQPRGFGPMWWSHVSCTSSPSLPRVWLVRQMPSKMMRMHRSAFRLRGIGLNAWTLSPAPFLSWWILGKSAGIWKVTVLGESLKIHISISIKRIKGHVLKGFCNSQFYEFRLERDLLVATIGWWVEEWPWLEMMGGLEDIKTVLG